MTSVPVNSHTSEGETLGHQRRMNRRASCAGESVLTGTDHSPLTRLPAAGFGRS